MGGDRRVQQSTVAARVHKASPQLRIAVVDPCSGQEPDERIFRATGVRLELRVCARDRRELRIQRQGALQARLGPLQLFVGMINARLAEHPIASTEVRPGRGIQRIGVNALQIKIPRQTRGIE